MDEQQPTPEITSHPVKKIKSFFANADAKTWLHFFEIFLIIVGVIVIVYFIKKQPSDKDAQNKELLQQNEVLAKNIDSLSRAVAPVLHRDSIAQIKIDDLRHRGDSLELILYHSEKAKDVIHTSTKEKISHINQIPAKGILDSLGL